MALAAPLDALVYVLGVAHTLGSGTDARAPWLLVTLGATALPIVFAATYRFLPSKREPAAKRPLSDVLPASQLAPSASIADLPSGGPRPERQGVWK